MSVRITPSDPFVTFEGQSLGNYPPDPGLPFPNRAMASFPGVSWANVAVDGRTIDELTAGGTAPLSWRPAATRVDGPASSRNGPKVCVCTIGSSNVIAGEGAAVILGKMQTFCAARKAAGYRTILATIPPGSLIVGSGFEANRVTVNTFLRAGAYPTAEVDALWSIDLDPLDDYTDLTYFLADQNHWNDTGSATGAALLVPILRPLLGRP